MVEDSKFCIYSIEWVIIYLDKLTIWCNGSFIDKIRRYNSIISLIIPYEIGAAKFSNTVKVFLGEALREYLVNNIFVFILAYWIDKFIQYRVWIGGQAPTLVKPVIHRQFDTRR